jgi:ribosomal protein L40E
MRQTLLDIALVVGILGFSAVATQLFARAMYLACSQCHTLNARRRSHCRKCGVILRA